MLLHQRAHARGGIGGRGDVGFDPEFPCSLDDRLKTRVRNSTQLQSLVACDAGISPTLWQQSRFPVEFRPKIRIIHEGVDTGLVGPDPQAVFEGTGRRFAAGRSLWVARLRDGFFAAAASGAAASLAAFLPPRARFGFAGAAPSAAGAASAPGFAPRGRNSKP